jgi:hypothetical protein
MKDVDPQQWNENQSAMTNIFVNTSESTCGYHLVTCKCGMEEEHTNMDQHLHTFKTQEVVRNTSSDSYMDLLMDESW